MKLTAPLTENRWDYYAFNVLADKIVACELVKRSCLRYLRDLERSKRDDFPYEFDEGRASDVIDFFRLLKLTKGQRKPKSFVPEDWQQFILAMLFGWVHKGTGLRRFRKAHIMVARKNGKSHLLAGIGLYGLVADDEMGAEIYSVATKKDQAKVIWDAAVDFRRFSKGFPEKIGKSVSTLFVRETSSKFQALASEEDGLDGLNVHIGLIDELQNHKNDNVYERIDTGKIARVQPLIISIATAGVEQSTALPCWREHEYSVNVLLGNFKDDTYFAYIAEADAEDDWEKEDTWRKANPNLDVPGGIKLEDLRAEAEAAKNEPAKLNSFLRLHLNRWTQQDTAWMPMHKWRLCWFPITDESGSKINLNDKKAVEDQMLAEWRMPHAGLDLSERNDITSLVLIFPPSERDERWVAQGYHFIPADAITERVKRDRVPYDVWVNEGRVIKTPGPVINYDFVMAEVLRLHYKNHLQSLAVDPHNAFHLCQLLKAQGVPVVEVQQGWKSLSDPTKELMSWVLTKKLNHLNDPVLNWMMGNVAVWRDAAGNIKPDKAKARERIDGVAAMINAMHVALSRQVSVYSSRGILTI